MKKKTAIRQLIEWIENDIHRNIPDNVILARAKAFEPINEQQIIDAAGEGYYEESSTKINGKEYFSETFEK